MRKTPLAQLFTFLFFAFAFNTFAQSTSVPRHAPFVYIYSVHASELKAIEKAGNDSKKIRKFLYNKVDSFPYYEQYSKQLKNGYYLIVSIADNHLQTSLEIKSRLSAALKNNNERPVLRLSNQQTQLGITDAKVYFQGKLVPYNTSESGYLIPGKRPKGDLLIVDGQDSVYLTLNKELSRKYNYGRGEEKWQGYIAVNKPRYLPGDTVKIKPYLLKNGKAYKKDVWITASYYDNTTWRNKLVWKKKISPLKAGAYECWFVCGDTLKIDKDYTLRLFKTEKGTSNYWNPLLSEKFKLEDYQLDEVQYDLQMAKSMFMDNDSVEFVLSAKDFNGQDVVDAIAFITVRPVRILSSLSAKAEIPYLIYQSEVKMQQGGETHFKIPASLFPQLNVDYLAEVKFSNSNKETKNVSVNFTCMRDAGHVKFADLDDSLLIEPMLKGKENFIAKIGLLKGDKPLRISEQTLPVKISLHEGFDEVNVEYRGKFFSWAMKNDKIYFKGERTHDSVFYRIQNPRKLTMEAELLKDGKVISKEKISGSKNFALADKSKAKYSFRYVVWWAGNSITNEYFIEARTKDLAVKLNAPATVFPGQEAEVKVEVKDFEGKAVQGANVCVASVNAQFGAVGMPALPDYNKPRRIKKKQFYKNELYELYTTRRNFELDTLWMKKYRLDTLHFYKIQFPGNKLYSRYLATGLNNAQFAPFLLEKGRLLSPLAVYIDDSLVYVNNIRWKGELRYSSAFNPSYWSFCAKTGKHRVRIRTKNAEYALTDVEFKKGYKLEVSFDVNHLPKEIAKQKAKTKMSEKEQQDIFSDLLVIQRSYSYGNNVLVQDSLCASFYAEGYGIFNAALPVHYKLNDYQNAYGIGKLNVKSGHIYELSSKGIKDSVLKKLPARFEKGNRYTGNSLIGTTALTHRKALFTILNQYRSNDVWYNNRYNRFRYDRDDVYLSTGNYTIATETENGNATLMVDILDSLSFGALCLFNEKSEAAYYLPFSEDLPVKVYNVSPGKYKLVYYANDGISYQRKDIVLKADSLLFVQLSEKEKCVAKDYVPEDAKEEEFSVHYVKSNAATISGTIKYKTESPADPPFVSIWKNQRLKQVLIPDANGNFCSDKLLPGFYHVSIPRSSNKADLVIYPVFISEAYSAEIKVLKTPESTEAFALLQGGKFIYKINPYRFFKTRLPEILNAGLNLNRGSTLPSEPTYSLNSNSYFLVKKAGQFYYVNNSDNYFSYYHNSWLPRIRIFRGRRRSSFFRSSYAPRYSGVRRVRAKFGGGDNVTGWAYNDPGSGGFEESENMRLEEVSVVAGVKSKSNDLIRMYDGISDNFETERYLNVDEDKRKFGTDSTFSFGSSLPMIEGNNQVIRSKFTDNAIWQPNLFTNEKGEASFKVKFPENITQWKSWAVVMAEGQQNGSDFSETKAYKNVMATLSLPRFLTEGDSTSSIGKALNYSGAPIKANTLFRVEGKNVFEKTEVIDKGKTEKIMYAVPFGGKDSVQVEYLLKAESAVSDGEKRTIPVLKQGVEIAEGKFFVLEHDTVFTLPALEKGVQYEISCMDNDLDVLLNRLHEIIAYEYDCNEQMASKVRALVLEKAVKDTLKDHFMHSFELRRLLKKLQKNQREDGAWSWWGQDKPNFFITAYILDALSDVKDKGGINMAGGLKWLALRLDALSDAEKIFALQILSKNKYAALDIPSEVRKLEQASKSLSLYDKARLLRIKQEQSMNYVADLKNILSLKKETMFGGMYWGDECYDVRDNYSTITAAMYRILKDEKNYTAELRRIRLFFVERSNNNTWRNTVESASILQNILPDVLAEYKNAKKTVQLKFGGDFTSAVKEFPVQSKAVSSGKELSVTKTGSGPAYFSLYQRKWIIKPQSISEYFSMRTSFEKDKKEIAELKAGEITVLKVTVEVKKKCDFVMIEVPIPAGCTYHSKEQKWNGEEAQREYFKNKTNIYIETLLPGTYTYEIELEPRYTGSYFMNPAKAELMYFPVFKGINEIKKVKIGE